MKAVRVHAPGGPEVMKYEDVDVPKPGAGEVLIKIAATGLNYLDVQYRIGRVKAIERRSSSPEETTVGIAFFASRVRRLDGRPLY